MTPILIRYRFSKLFRPINATIIILVAVPNAAEFPYQASLTNIIPPMANIPNIHHHFIPITSCQLSQKQENRQLHFN